MKKCIIITAIGLQAFVANAQISVSGANGQVFQFNTVTNSLGVFESVSGKAVTGRPLAATEERHSLQVLGDGTRIEKTDTDKFYRDDMGRTRTERQDGTVIVNDPVQGVSAEVNGNRKMIRRNTATTSKDISAVVAAKLKAEMLKAETTTATVMTDSATPVTVEGKLKAEALAKTAARQEEDLGYQSINGVTAQGFRTTTTIPAGQIGNDRPIQVVSERWYSQDLQMNVKTTNSDPRFGETTYQLTNIVQAAPDATLFQVPQSRLGETVP
jgi:hypothetical protein